MQVIAGEALPPAQRLLILEEGDPVPQALSWRLRATASYERYVNRKEHEELARKSPPLSRNEATRAALIPIRKSERWWALSAEERRAIFEEQSDHIKTGLQYLPAIARKLYQCRDLGEPFDFLTWFEFAPKDELAFDELLARLRRTKEWTYVDREIDIRLTRAG